MKSLNLPPSPAWQLDAACANEAPEDFMVRPSTKALEACRRCPVVRECGEFARDAGEQSGVWGGRILGAAS